MRSRVLGPAYVAANGGSDPDGMSALHRMVTEFGWGTVWTREELAPSQRSIATVAMLIALDRPHELRVHVRGALRNGLAPDQIRELAIQAVAYCGFPAALDAMRTIDDVLRQVEAEVEPADAEPA